MRVKMTQQASDRQVILLAWLVSKASCALHSDVSNHVLSVRTRTFGSWEKTTKLKHKSLRSGSTYGLHSALGAVHPGPGRPPGSTNDSHRDDSRNQKHTAGISLPLDNFQVFHENEAGKGEARRLSQRCVFEQV